MVELQVMTQNTVKEWWDKAQDQVKVWKESKSRVLAQLNSVHNLVGQLEALHSCLPRSTGPSHCLGVVGEHPLCVELLEVKLVQAMEKAFVRAMKER